MLRDVAGQAARMWIGESTLAHCISFLHHVDFGTYSLDKMQVDVGVCALLSERYGHPAWALMSKCNKYCRGLLSFSMWFYGCTWCSVHPLSPLQGDPPSTEYVFNGQCEVRPASHCEAVHFAWGSFLIADTSRQQRTNGKFFWPPVFPQADSSACYWGHQLVICIHVYIYIYIYVYIYIYCLLYTSPSPRDS